jgi:shikimate kinase
MLQKRTPLYQTAADLRIETTKLTHDDVADIILAEAEKRNA